MSDEYGYLRPDGYLAFHDGAGIEKQSESFAGVIYSVSAAFDRGRFESRAVIRYRQLRPFSVGACRDHDITAVFFVDPAVLDGVFYERL